MIHNLCNNGILHAKMVDALGVSNGQLELNCVNNVNKPAASKYSL